MDSDGLISTVTVEGGNEIVVEDKRHHNYTEHGHVSGEINGHSAEVIGVDQPNGDVRSLDEDVSTQEAQEESYVCTDDNGLNIYRVFFG